MKGKRTFQPNRRRLPSAARIFFRSIVGRDPGRKRNRRPSGECACGLQPCKRTESMKDVAGLTMLGLSAVVPFWVARAVLGLIVAGMAKRRPDAPRDTTPAA